MEISYRVLENSELDKVVELEQRLLATLKIPEDEAFLLSWHAPWRRESLDHYATTGWSFAAWRGEDLVGYFLAQPIVFFRGFTQTLWIEHVAGLDEQIKTDLIDLARRYGRDKHLQSVLFADNADLRSVLLKAGGQTVAQNLIEFRTTKVRI